MIKRSIYVLCLLVTIFYSNVFSGLPFTTHVVLKDGTTRSIQDIKIFDQILSYHTRRDLTDVEFDSSRMLLNEKRKIKKIYCITTESGVVTVDSEQSLFNAVSQKFINVGELTTKDKLLNINLEPVCIKSIRVVDLD